MVRSSSESGFTLTELIVVIIVIGILASISTVSYVGWRESMIDTQLKNDLSAAVSAMENERNFSTTGYSTSLPDSFRSSEDVTVTLEASDKTSFCIKAISISDASRSLYVDETGEVKEDSCDP